MTVYLHALLAATLLLPLQGAPGLSPQLIWLLWCVPGLVGLAWPIFLPNPRTTPLFWPLALVALGRSVLFLHDPGYEALPYALAAWTAPAAALVAVSYPGEVRQALRCLSVPLLALAVTQLACPNCFMNRNTVGMALIGPLAASLPDNWRSWRQYAPVAPVALVCAGLALTLSRGALLSALVMAGWYYHALGAALPLAAAVFPLLMQARNPMSVPMHLAYWRGAWDTWRSAPIIGAGPGGQVHYHNLILTTAAWTGLAGLGALGGAVVKLHRYVRRLPRWAGAGLLGLLLCGLVDDWSGQPLIMGILAGLLTSEHVGHDRCDSLHDHTQDIQPDQLPHE